MTRMTGPDCVVMCNLINTHTHTHIHACIHTHKHTFPNCLVYSLWEVVAPASGQARPLFYLILLYLVYHKEYRILRDLRRVLTSSVYLEVPR